METGRGKKKRTGIIVAAALGVTLILAIVVILVRVQSFSDTGILVEYSSEPAWYEQGIDKSSGTEIVFYNDGKAEIRNTPVEVRENQQIPSVSFTINSDVVKGLQKEIVMMGFIFLWEDISTRSSDGSYIYITVHTQSITHKSGGLNPSDFRFRKMEDAIRAAVPDEVMSEYNAAVEEYYAD